MSKLDEIEARQVAAGKACGITYDERRQAFREPPDLVLFDRHSIGDVEWLIARVRQLETTLIGIDQHIKAIENSDATMGVYDLENVCAVADLIVEALKES